MKPIIILFAILLSVFACNAQDIIVLKTGEEIKATITEVGISEVKYKKFGFEGGPVYIQLKSSIIKIKYANGSEDVFYKPEKATIVAEQPETSVSITENTNHRAHAVYADILGNSILWSVNYDARFGRKRNGFGARVGIGYTSFSRGNSSLTAPIMLNYLGGKKGKFFELGLGGIIYISDNNISENGIIGNYFNLLPVSIGNNPVIGTITLGFRYQPTDGGFLFKGSLTPFFGLGEYSDYDYATGTTITRDEFFFWPFFGGVALGYAFP